MKYCILLLTIVVVALASFAPPAPFVSDRTEAKKAFELINRIRQHPRLYDSALKLYWALPITESRLIWNDTLAAVAERKALDMVSRNYFAHVDPKGFGMNYYINKGGYRLIPDFLKDKAANNFESIHAGSATGEDAVRSLILDKGVPGMGHRNHLLGIGQWNSSLTDIGIGFVRCDSGCGYRSYMSVVIAKHRW